MDQVEALATEVLHYKDVQCDELIIHFVSVDQIKKLHKKHFDDSSSTDCITLPIDDPGPSCEILGEVFICPDTAIIYAKRHKLDVYEECSLYIVHGILHLLGFDDIESADIAKMRAAEKEIMDHLREKNLILTPPN
ncbi:MAG: rRNA maturation RNase YbeY [Chlamydiales bacterium]|nr:rRNA maturation RNase YbeY [Chlamydiales bacterium]